MVVRIRLFAQLREHAGSEFLDAALPDGATVAEALRELAQRPPLDELLARLPVRMAVNRELAGADVRLHPGDELALLPPVSGGAGPHVRVTAEPIDARAVTELVRRPGAGAVVTFEGVVRDVEFLDYEAYREMAEEQMARIVADARRAPRARGGRRRAPRRPRRARRARRRRRGLRRPPRGGLRRRARDHRPDQGAGRDLEARARRRPGALGGAGGVSRADAPRRRRRGADGRRRRQGRDERRARARARVRMSPATAAAVAAGNAPKGEVLGTARLAGILAAKQTAGADPARAPDLAERDRRDGHGRRRGRPRRARQ